MSNGLWIPPATRDRLAHPAPPGQRHEHMKKIAVSLIGRGFTAENAFELIRPGYGAEIADSEIIGLINWAINNITAKNRDTGWIPPFTSKRNAPPLNSGNAVQGVPPESAITRFLGEFSCDESDLWDASPVRLTGEFETDAETLLLNAYNPGDLINIVAHFSIRDGKAQPTGRGVTISREKWINRFREIGPPVSKSGVWIRLNPTDGMGVSNGNVTDFKFALLEFDSVPISLQLPFFARLPLAITAIITSGGKSLHAWAFIGADNANSYRESVCALFAILKPFGIDSANSNSGRLSRLPGVSREFGGYGDKRQRLLYLNPLPKAEPILK